nr:MAG TPA: hypothetical protein [Caudoviricetes sp.]
MIRYDCCLSGIRIIEFSMRTATAGYFLKTVLLEVLYHLLCCHWHILISPSFYIYIITRMNTYVNRKRRVYTCFLRAQNNKQRFKMKNHVFDDYFTFII